MAGITGLPEPGSWGSIGGSVGGAAGEMLSGASVAASMAVPGLGWANLGLQLLGGLMSSSESSQTGGQSYGQSQLQTSGWAVGKSNAQGADSKGALSQLSSIPWWGWAGFTLAAVILIRKA